MILELLLLLLFSILFLLLMLKSSTSSKLLLPPGPPKLPIIGNLHQLVGSKLQMHEQLSKLAKKHGPLMHLQLGEVSTVVVSDPDTVKEVLKTNDLIFSNRPSFLANKLLSFGESSVIFSPHGQYWQRMRKLIVLELLNPRRVRSFRSIREGEVNNLVKYISSSQGSVFNISNKMFEFANVVICKSAFGEHLKSKQTEELIHLLETINQLGGLNLAALYPSWKFLRHMTSVFLKRRIEIADGKISRVLDNILDNHRHNKEDVGDDVHNNVQDLVDVLLRIQESDEGGMFRITTNNIKAVLFDIMAGGTDTTSTTMNWALAEIIRNPNVMKKVQSEVREAMKVKKKQQLEESDIENLKYLKLVIKETLRLHPPFPLMQRTSSKKCTVNGYDLPDWSTVVINLWALGRDPRYWKNPKKFEPERFVESSVDFNGMHFQFLPFGLGRRICPGIAFAGINVEMVLAALLYHFDWKLPDGKNGEELDMTASFGVTAKRKKDLYVIATKVC